MRTNSVSSAGRLREIHDYTSIAQELAISGGITKGITSQIDEGHSIRPNQVKNKEAALA